MGLYKPACRSVAMLLWDFADRRLPEHELERVERHLATCAQCRAGAERYRSAAAVLKDARTGTLPASRMSWSDLESRLRAAPIGRRPVRRVGPVYSTGLVAAAALAAAVFVLVRPYRKPETPARVVQHRALVALGPAAPLGRAPGSPHRLPGAGRTVRVMSTQTLSQPPATSPSPSPHSFRLASALPVRRVRSRPGQAITARLPGRAGSTNRLAPPAPGAAMKLVSIDGDIPSSQGTPRYYVMSPVVYSTDAAARQYVMQEMPSRAPGLQLASAHGSDTEKPVW